MTRCPWADATDLDRAYHDDEWGVPVRDDHRLFEMLTLEGAQAGLSWSTILAKREGYRRAFARFEIGKVARFTPRRVEKILLDPGVVRHRGKIESTVGNARAAIAAQEEFGSLATLLWGFVDGEPIRNRWKKMEDVPAATPASKAMSKELKRLGFRFVGPTTCYALMQAAGMVNDHLTGCFRHREIAEQIG